MDDLVTWLRAQLDADEAEWQPIAGGPRQNGKTLARRMLREVDAKRRLIDAILAVKRPTYRPGVGRPGTHHPARPVGPDPRPRMLRLLALPYADRPGYQPEWRPDPTNLT